jgi:hypothetical protein
MRKESGTTSDDLIKRSAEEIVTDMRDEARSLGEIWAAYSWPPYWDEIVKSLMCSDINYSDTQIETLIGRCPNNSELGRQVEHKLMITQIAAFELGLAIADRIHRGSLAACNSGNGEAA